jgi:hypothetical protein
MDKVYSLREIKKEVDRLAARVGASADLLPTYGYSEDGARPHIEVDARGYHYAVVERGQEISRITTSDLDELLFHVFAHVTFELASQYELKHRVKHQDFRRLMFRRQIELLTVLSPTWAEIESQSHERILRQHPYTDSLTHS